MASEVSTSGKDGYARTARYVPGMLVLAPVGVVVTAGGWQDSRIVTALLGIAAAGLSLLRLERGQCHSREDGDQGQADEQLAQRPTGL